MNSAPPSLRTVRAVFPHTALQLVVACNGLSKTEVGLAQTIIPVSMPRT